MATSASASARSAAVSGTWQPCPIPVEAGHPPDAPDPRRRGVPRATNRPAMSTPVPERGAQHDRGGWSTLDYAMRTADHLRLHPGRTRCPHLVGRADQMFVEIDPDSAPARPAPDPTLVAPGHSLDMRLRPAQPCRHGVLHPPPAPIAWRVADDPPATKPSPPQLQHRRRAVTHGAGVEALTDLLQHTVGMSRSPHRA
jgi:hypothetical protein